MSDHLRENKRFLIILAGLALAAAAGVALNQSIRYHHQKAAAKRMAAAKTMVVPKRGTPSQKPARLLDKRPAVSKRIEKKSVLPKTIKEPDYTKNKAKTPPAPVSPSRAAPSAGLNRKALPPIHPEKGSIAAKGIEKPEAQVKPERFSGVSIKKSNDTKIIIQAIAWSKDPKGRLAVINGLILREGESIDNVMVVHIGKDVVVFEKNRKEWKQMFGF